MDRRPRLKSFAPQLLVDDLDRAIKFYRDVLGFSFGADLAWILCHRRARRFCGPSQMRAQDDRGSRQSQAAPNISMSMPSVIGVAALYDACKAKGATILKPLARTPWGTDDFYIDDPEGYIIAFGEADNPN